MSSVRGYVVKRRHPEHVSTPWVAGCYTCSILWNEKTHDAALARANAHVHAIRELMLNFVEP